MNQIGVSAEGRTITAVLGPTNTGKTHYAIERMLSRPDGVIGLPLRLLAREVYDRIAAIRGRGAVSLRTGEEKIAPATARYHVCTVEAMPLDLGTDFVAVDEVQLCADPERGHVFTDRLMRARGRYETLFLGSDTMRKRIASLVPEARFMGRERFSKLAYTGSRKISRLKPRSAVVAFSADQVYAIAELIRRQRGGAAVVLGALSPRTRNAQVELYENGDVDYLVATDAIGMGLNLDVDHVAFAGLAKFDGWRHRHLEPNELAQIAGRAGRFTRDGTFGVTGEASGLDEQVIEAIEGHSFRPLDRLMWRNHALDFGSVPGLIASLDAAPDRPDLARAREADDMATLRLVWADPEMQEIATRPDRIRLLWDVCQTPDFRQTVSGDHAGLISRIYRFLLSDAGVIPSDWLAGQLRRIDRVDGDIDTLSKRLAFVRTWTYVANRANWVEDPGHWRDETRQVEDRLSDALHQRLTQRFVDRRTSVLMRRLKQKERLVAEVNDKGEVSAEGEYLGRLDGFRFTVDETATGDEKRALQSASVAALQAEFARRADKLYLSPDSEIDVTEQGGLMWGEQAIGRVEKGDAILAPKVTVFVDEMVEPGVAEKVERRLSHWLQRRINALFEPMIQMQADEAIAGMARGVAFRIGEGLGIQPRRAMAEDVRGLGQEERALLRKHGVRFGQHHIFMPALLKPAATRMRLILWSLWEGFDDFPSAPPAGHVTVETLPGMPQGYYEKAGYRVSGARAVRIDMLERLADMLRPMDAKAGFEATADMLSITGCTLDQFAEIMKGLGFEAERGERAKTAKPAAKEDGGAAPEAEAEGATADTATDGESAPAGTEAQAAEAAEAASGTGQPDGAESPAPATDGTAGETPEAAAPVEASEDARSAETSEAEPSAEASDGMSAPAPADAAGEGGDAPAPEAALSEAEAPVSETGAAKTDAEATDAEAPAAKAAGAEPGDAATDAPAADSPGDGEAAAELEVFFTFRLRPRQGRGGPGGRRQGGGQPGERSGPGRGAEGGRGAGKGGPRGRKGKGGRQDEDGGGPRGPKGPKGPKGGGKPRREDKPVDPDSPFAILQQLKKS